MTAGINTPQELEAKPGIIAVLLCRRIGADVVIESPCDGIFSSWWQVVKTVCELRRVCADANIKVDIGDAQQVRLLGDGDDAVVVVSTPDTPFGKSLPRTMRRLLKRMRDDRRATEAAA